MSRGRNWLKRQKQLNAAGKRLEATCRYCGVTIPTSVYDMDDPMDYQCPMCGKYPWAELKELLERNKNFRLTEENSINPLTNPSLYAMMLLSNTRRAL